MNLSRSCLSAVLAIELCAAGGCALVPKTTLTACETRSRNLAEQSKTQLAEIENLKRHSARLEEQLLEAEGALALADDRPEANAVANRRP